MLKLIRYLIFGDSHSHIWEEYREFEVTKTHRITGYDLVSDIVLIRKCKTCGKLKEFKISSN